MVIVLWLETSPLDQQETVCPMSMVNLCILREDFLDKMVTLIPGASNPDTLCLIQNWQNHLFLSPPLKLLRYELRLPRNMFQRHATPWLV